jgi:hypothetical protein
MAEMTPKQEMQAFDDEVAPLYDRFCSMRMAS